MLTKGLATTKVRNPRTRTLKRKNQECGFLRRLAKITCPFGGRSGRGIRTIRPFTGQIILSSRLIQGLAGDFPDQHKAWRTRLIAVSAQIDPSIAAKTLAEALGRETEANARPSLASALSEVAGRMDPTKAAASAARPPRHSPKHWAMRRMPMPAGTRYRRCRLCRAGWSRPRPLRFAGM